MMLTRRATPRSWTFQLRGAVWMLAIVAVGIISGGAVAAVVGDVRARGTLALWVLLLCHAIVVATFIVCLRSIHRWPSLATTSVAVVAAGVGTVAGTSVIWIQAPPVSELTAHSVPIIGFVVLLITIVASTRNVRHGLGGVVASTAAFVALRSLGNGSEAWASIDDVVLPASLACSCLLVNSALRRGALAALAVAKRRRRIHAVAAVDLHAEQAEAESRRVVHDRVISALRAVEVSDDPAMAAGECRSALRAINSLNPTSSSEQLRDELLARNSPRVNLGGDGWAFEPPTRVVAALRESVGEAMRNAYRHGGVTEVDVTFSTTSHGQVVARVVDQGTGFSEDATPGFGLTESIAGRMRDIGGGATVEGRPGEGVTVELVWPQLNDVPDPRMRELVAASDRSAVYFLAAAPPMVANVFLAIRHVLTDGDAALTDIGVALAAAAVLGVCSWLVGRSRPSWSMILAGATFNAAATWLALRHNPAEVLLGAEAWVIGAVACVIAVLAFEASVPKLIALWASQIAVTLFIAAHAPHVGPFQPMDALVAPVGAGLVAALAGRLVRRGARISAVYEALLSAEADSEAWVENSKIVRRRFAEQLQHDVAPFLQLVGSGQADLASLRPQATALSARCRDLLQQADVVPAAARQAMLEARQDGMTVNVRGSSDVGIIEWHLLSTVLGVVGSAEATTLIPSRDGAAARISTIPAASPSEVRLVQARMAPTAVGAEHTEVSTTFFLVAPKRVTTRDASDRLGLMA